MRHISDGVAAALIPAFHTLYEVPEQRAWDAACRARDALLKRPDDHGSMIAFIRATSSHEECVLRMAAAKKALRPPASRIYR